MIKLLCFLIVIFLVYTKVAQSKHFVLFKNGYTTNITPLLITLKGTLTHCLTICSHTVLCYAVSIEKVSQNQYQCSLYKTIDYNTTTWEIQANSKVFVKLLDSCLAYRIHDFTKGGVYKLSLDEKEKPFEVWCDMVNEGGGWAVLLRRESDKISFKKNWNEYKNGFGQLDKSFWLGNDKIHKVTNAPANELRIDLIDSTDVRYVVRYDNFHVFNESTNYTMEHGKYNIYLSNANDCLMLNYNTSVFSTYDQDNDKDSGWHCSTEYGNAGWWFTDCHYGLLTGRYMANEQYIDNNWCTSLEVKYSELKVRKGNSVLK